MKNPTLRQLEMQAQEQVKKVRDKPAGRYQLREEFYKKYGFSEVSDFGYGSSELAFMRWEIERGVLNPLDHPKQPGSPWWRAVNEEFLYLSELAGYVYEAALDETKISQPMKFWLAYFGSPSAQSWYRAHNGSIVSGYLNQVAEAKQESRPEQIFINMVLYRVLYAQSMVEDSHISLGELGHILGNPDLPAVDALVHLPNFYPRHYPLSQEDITDIMNKGHDLADKLVETFDGYFIIKRLTKLYHLAAGWLNMPNLELLINDGQPVYPFFGPAFGMEKKSR